MSKIYEALENAVREQKVLKKPKYPSALSPITPSYPKPLNLEMEQLMIRLYRTLDSMLRDSTKRSIQFIGSREGEGTSTIVREFARVSAMEFDKSVLLLDADRHMPSQNLSFNIKPEYGWDDVVRDDMPIDKALYQIRRTSLFISPISGHSTSSQIFNSPKFDVFFDKSKERFDLILVDSPPATLSSDGLAICRNVDGIVLVLEAEKTRWPVAENVKDKIIKNGGKILGMVFNKRRYHIPEFIYRQL